MTRKKLNFAIILLALIFIATSVLSKNYVQSWEAENYPLRLAIAFLAASPVFFSFWLMMRTYNKLAPDEYLQKLMMNQMWFATFNAMGMMAVMGFMTRTDLRNGDEYVPYPIIYLMWALFWVMAGFGEHYIGRKNDDDTK